MILLKKEENISNENSLCTETSWKLLCNLVMRKTWETHLVFTPLITTDPKIKY